MKHHQVTGILITLTGMFLPFYIGWEVLPAGWSSINPPYWWTVPMWVALPVLGIVLILKGVKTCFPNL